MDVDRLVKDALEERAARPRFDADRWDPSVARRVPMRRFPGLPPARSVAVAVAAVILLAGVALPLALLAGLGPEGNQRPSAPAEVDPNEPSPASETHTDPEDGLRITIPDTWTFHPDPTEPIEPENVLAVGSWPFPAGGVCAPFDALDDLPSDGAFFWLMEYHGTQRPQAFVPRPERFDLSQFRYGTEYSCYGVVPQYQLRFRDQGRFFQLQVAFGAEATGSLQREVLAAVDSIEVTAPIPEGCPEGTGPWSDPDCPQPAWVRDVVAAAGYEITGDTGSALVGRGGGTGFYIWTTRQESLESRPFEDRIADEGYRKWATVAGVDIFTDEVRAVWTVHGLHVWVEGGPVDDVPELGIVDPLVRASQGLDYDEFEPR